MALCRALEKRNFDLSFVALDVSKGTGCGGHKRGREEELPEEWVCVALSM